VTARHIDSACTSLVLGRMEWQRVTSTKACTHGISLGLQWCSDSASHRLCMYMYSLSKALQWCSECQRLCVPSVVRNQHCSDSASRWPRFALVGPTCICNGLSSASTSNQCQVVLYIQRSAIKMAGAKAVFVAASNCKGKNYFLKGTRSQLARVDLNLHCSPLTCSTRIEGISWSLLRCGG